MKFHFCGQLDCPDWVLAEIATLSRITSIKMKLLCSQVVDGILGTPIDFEKVNKLTADAKYEKGDIKATVAALTFIFTSSAKHGIEEESLLKNELQQLGLPKESTAALCKVFSDKYLVLQQKLKKESLKLTEIQSFDWQVNYIKFSSLKDEVNDPSVQLNLKIKELKDSSDTNLHTINMSSKTLILLLHGKMKSNKTKPSSTSLGETSLDEKVNTGKLKQAYAIIEEISSSS